MRLDKFLKVSRIIKRRTLAKEVCDGGRIQINGRPAKASSEVKAGDILELDFGQRRLRVRVVEIKENVPAALAGQLYEILEEIKVRETTF
ncbi:MAG: RNA-binding S4 domain-containing protein [Bacillota bacterium]|uniref:RQC P-site tRNA stabilizing factor n=2 Tax=Carboxydocella TaxID=178898 RepID=A0A1T4SG15_9FIRM|nr:MULTISPECIES: RNA-binding S4 domain-containing protein [Carboxydocella]AVX19289.1 Ribosomal 50S subunit-recycling heat shock protein, contains S4 domain [Carboxydocella thermautotrophica]AVX29704.1 Ribosomal 50S subunit-recycling heat shock protein, contains S4 domain [Carboxydocella thermautotrophica]SKA26751.1 Ribosomal 50S subunit-recycling heat shock protein, contains S4 domain [Carboxydocella sporoproducens DSM 16521]GAW27461.1 RNA-binding protein S4 [Carboxydocella sp. ULO1]GAW30360.1